MHPLYEDAEERYKGFRDAVYDVTWRAWQARLNGRQLDLKLLPVDKAALQQAEQLWKVLENPGRPETFDWRAIYGQVRTTPRRFDMAIWNGSMLCGLVIGKASRGTIEGDLNVTIRFLQGAPPMVNLLKGFIAPIAIDAADAYAAILGRKMLYLKALLPEVVPLYQSFGFSVVKRKSLGVYLGRRV